MAPTTRRGFMAGSALGALALAAGCESTHKAAANASMDKVVYLTGFGTTPREEHIQIGIAKGYFQDAGIELTVEPGQPSDANLKSLAAGKAQFASIDFVSAIRGANTWVDGGGKPNYRIIAAVQQRTLLSMITLSDLGITRPADLVGHTLGAAPAAATQTLFPTYAREAGFDVAKVKFQNAASDQLPSLLAAGRVDAIGAYSVDTPTVAAAAKGRTPLVLPYSQYLTDLYGTVLLAPASVVTSKPDLAKRFAGAVMKGIQYAVAHPDEAGQIIKKAIPTTNAESAAQTMKLMAPDVGSGALDPVRVMRGIAVLQAGGLAPAGLQPEAILQQNVMPKDS